MSLTGAGLRTMRSVPNFGTIGALAEIIDNSIQWRVPGKKCIINVVMITKGHSNTVSDFYITDNGQGMGDIIDTCLWFGGGTNHGKEEGLGKYGVGLPFACCSQTEHYHVYSWTKSGHFKHVYRNHKEVKDEDLLIDKPHTVLPRLPQQLQKTCPELNAYESGTVIHWQDCDRVDPKKSATIIKHLDELLGRIYRHYISDELEINWKPFKQAAGSDTPVLERSLVKPLVINDPIRLKKSHTLLEQHPYNIPPGEQDLFLPLNSEPVIIQSKPDPNIANRKHSVTINTTYAKEEIQKPGGLDGGRTPIGSLMKRNIPMISLVRANRELRLSNFGFPVPNAGDTRIRWIKIEVKFEPISDTLFGVNANKTDAKKFNCLDEDTYFQFQIDGQSNIPWDIEFRHDISCEISRQISEAFTIIENRGKGTRREKKKSKCEICNEFLVLNGECSNCGPVTRCLEHNIVLINGRCHLCDHVLTPRFCINHKIQLDETGACPECQNTPPDPLSDDERDRLYRILKNSEAFKTCTEDGINRSIDWFIQSNKSYFLVIAPNDQQPDSFLTYSVYDGRFTVIFVNASHPFYSSHIEKHYIEGDDELEALILFLISWVSSEKSYATNPETAKKISQFRSKFGLELSENLSEWVSINRE